MNKGYIIANNLQIACYTYNPTQVNTIFFIHGNSSSSGAWRNQVESTLLTDYRLVAIDLPSHGNSDAIDAGGDFSLPGIAKIVGTTIHQLIDNKPYIICGLSLGTNVVAEMLASDFFPKGLIFAAPNITGKDFGIDKMIQKDADLTAVFAENLPEDIIKKYRENASISTDENDILFFLNDYFGIKGNFRSSFYHTVAKGLYNDQIALLQKRNCPVCIVFGKEEKFVNTDYLDDARINLWNNTIYKIPAARHFVNVDAPEAFNKLLAEFARDMFTTNAA